MLLSPLFPFNRRDESRWMDGAHTRTEAGLSPGDSGSRRQFAEEELVPRTDAKQEAHCHQSRSVGTLTLLFLFCHQHKAMILPPHPTSPSPHGSPVWLLEYDSISNKNWSRGHTLNTKICDVSLDHTPTLLVVLFLHHLTFFKPAMVTLR